jgi:hypothetical protein
MGKARKDRLAARPQKCFKVNDGVVLAVVEAQVCALPRTRRRLTETGDANANESEKEAS